MSAREHDSVCKPCEWTRMVLEMMLHHCSHRLASHRLASHRIPSSRSSCSALPGIGRTSHGTKAPCHPSNNKPSRPSTSVGRSAGLLHGEQLLLAIASFSGTVLDGHKVRGRTALPSRCCRTRLSWLVPPHCGSPSKLPGKPYN